MWTIAEKDEKHSNSSIAFSVISIKMCILFLFAKRSSNIRTKSNTKKHHHKQNATLHHTSSTTASSLSIEISSWAHVFIIYLFYAREHLMALTRFQLTFNGKLSPRIWVADANKKRIKLNINWTRQTLKLWPFRYKVQFQIDIMLGVYLYMLWATAAVATATATASSLYYFNKTTNDLEIYHRWRKFGTSTISIPTAKSIFDCDLNILLSPQYNLEIIVVAFSFG